MKTTRQFPWAALLVLALVLPGCQQQTGEEAPPAVRVENPKVGVAIAALHPFFKVEVNDGEQFILKPADDQVAGSLQVIAMDPPELGGVNLVAAVNEHADEMRAIEGAEYKGQQELGGPLGTAYYSRGQFPDDGGQTTEEVSIFMMHPWGDRILKLVYSYPAADDSKERLQDQLFEVLGELEPLDVPPPTVVDETPS